MAHWLFKSEPSAWSYEKVAGLGAAGTDWSGVRNHTAKLNMQAMKVGEQAFFYHSNEGKEIVGIVEVSQGLPARSNGRDRQVRDGGHPRVAPAAATGDAGRGEGRQASGQDGACHAVPPLRPARDRRRVGGGLQAWRPLTKGLRPRHCAGGKPEKNSGLGGAMASIRPALVIACLPLLGGCMATAQRERMSGALDPYIGGSIASFVADHGEPASSVDLGDHESAFRWVLTGQGAGGAVPIGSSIIVVPPRQLVCTISLTATTTAAVPEYKDWIVTSDKWQGAC